MEVRPDQSKSPRDGEDGQKRKDRTWFLKPKPSHLALLKKIGSEITGCFGLNDNSRNQEDRPETSETRIREIGRSM